MTARLRFDYQVNTTADMVNVAVVSESDDVHTLCGRLVMERAAWDRLWKAIVIGNNAPNDILRPAEPQQPSLSSFFGFVNKGEQT